jgi:hypothetical protein
MKATKKRFIGLKGIFGGSRKNKDKIDKGK